MSRILFVLFCCYVLEVQAIVLPGQPQQPEQQETKKATTNKPLSPKAQSKSTEKQPSSTNSSASKIQNISKPAKTVLTSPSKASLGFYQAATNENYDMMELYLQQGADINCLNCTDRAQITALYRALGNNNVWNYQLADWMIQRGADINIPAISYQATGKTLVMRTADHDIPNLSALESLVSQR